MHSAHNIRIDNWTDPTPEIYPDELFSDPTYLTNATKNMKDRAKNTLLNLPSPVGKKQYILPPQKNIDNIPGNTQQRILLENIATPVGLCEVQGARHTQEDSMAYAAVFGFEKLNKRNQTEVLKQTFKIIETTVENNYLKPENQYFIGSTAIVCTAWEEKHQNRYNLDLDRQLNLKLAQAGDSSGFLVIVSVNGQVKCKRINKTTHHPLPENNAIYNEEALRWELSKGLPLTHAIGDLGQENLLNREPEITHFAYTLDDDDQAFIVLCCDGMTEDLGGMTSNPNTVQQQEALIKAKEEQAVTAIFKDHYTKQPDEIAMELVKRAARAGVGDNISVIVHPVANIKTTQQMQPVSIAVFDGHGGQYVAKYLGEQFYPEFQRQIEKLLSLQQTQQQMIDQLASYVNTKYPQHHSAGIVAIKQLIANADHPSTLLEKIQTTAITRLNQVHMSGTGGRWGFGFFNLFKKQRQPEQQGFYEALKQLDIYDAAQLKVFKDKLLQATFAIGIEEHRNQQIDLP